MAGNIILADANATEARIKISGRATFVFGQDLQEFFTRVMAAGVKQIVVDASECASMDSTFMGVLAMAALDQTQAVSVVIANPTKKVVDQLTGLGILRYFTLTERVLSADCLHPLGDLMRGLQKDEATLRDTMVRAHEALGTANPANIERFRQVVELLKKG